MTSEDSSLTRRLLELVRVRMSDHMELLQRLVALPSHASIPGGTADVANAIIPLLHELGFTVEAISQTPLDEDLRWVEEIMIPGQHQQDLGPTYLAKRDSESTSCVLLLGDLDTSYPLSAHEAFPVRLEGSLFYGPGIADMKGGLVVLIAALKALADAEVGSPEIEVVLTSDEQAGSLGSRHIIQQSASRCSWTLCVECGRRGGKLMATRGHIGIGDLTARGVEAHVGSAFEEGVNATEYLARVIPPVNALSRSEDGILVTVTILKAGRRRSVFPDRAWAVIDIRTRSEGDWNDTVERIQKTVAQHGDRRVEVRTYAHRPGVLWEPRTDTLLSFIRARGAEIGVEIEAFSSPAAGSTAFAGIAGSVVMDGMGPVGGGLMTHDEHVDVSTIPERAAILAATLVTLNTAG